MTDAVSLPYHLGRFTTYGALGFAAALLSKQVASFSWWPQVAAAMLATAGIMFLLNCLRSCLHAHHHAGGRLTYLRGVLLGFIPCGLLYAAVMMAATLANPWAGMVAMWLFTLGTMPALIVVGGGAAWLTRKWQHGMVQVGRAMMVVNGLSLLVMAAHEMR